MPKTTAYHDFSLAIEYLREEDGRWLADIPALPGVTAYGRSKRQATAAVQALALRLITDRLEHGEAVLGPMNVTFVAAWQNQPELAVHQSWANQASEWNLAPYFGTSGMGRCLVRIPRSRYARPCSDE